MKKITLIFFTLIFSFSLIYSGRNNIRTRSAGSNRAAHRNARVAANAPNTGNLFGNFNPDDPQGNQEEQRVGYTLKQIIKKILRISPLMEASRSSEEIYRMKLKQIKAERNPSISASAFLMPMPEIPTPGIGQKWYNVINFNKWGLGSRFSFTLSFPLYTFGRIPAGLQAARNGIRVQQIERRDTRMKLVEEIKKYYYGYLLAVSIKEFILKTVMSKLESSIEKTKEKYRDGRAKKSDIYRLNIFHLQLQAAELELKKNIKLAKEAFKTFLEIPANREFKIKEDMIVENNFTLKPLKTYIKMAFQNNPDYRKALYGLAARRALYEYKRAELNPVLYFGFTTSYTGRFPGFQSVFDISGIQGDDFNIYMGFGLSFSRHIGKTKFVALEARAEYRKLEAQVKFLKMELPIKIKKAYYDLKDAKIKLDLALKAYLNGKKWMFHTYKLYKIGTGDATDLEDGFSRYANTRKDYFTAIYNYNMKIAELSRLVGRELLNMRY